MVLNYLAAPQQAILHIYLPHQPTLRISENEEVVRRKSKEIHNRLAFTIPSNNRR